MASTGMVDPFEAVSRRQSYVKKDSIKLFIKASECVTVDELSTKKGVPKRILWRPPRNYQIQAKGDVHGDARGCFGKYFGSKIVIKNKCNGDIRYKATVPVGKMADPTKIYARPYVTEGTIKPTGTKKDMSRTKGKGKAKREKNYSKAVDQATLDITERNLFTGDANLYTLYEEKIPGDNATSPTYYTMGKGLVDLAIILPNSNQYSGTKYQDDLIVAEVIVVTRYLTTEQGQGVDAVDTANSLAYYIGNLNSMNALYHRDVDPIVTAYGPSMALEEPRMTHLPLKRRGESYYTQVGLKVESNEAHLYYYAGDQPVEKVRWETYENENVRMAISCLHLTVGEGGRGQTSSVGSLEMGFDATDHTWKAVRHDGTVRTFSGLDKGDARHLFVHAMVPVTVYSVALPSPGSSGLITNYGDINAKAISWASIVSALTTTVKVLTMLGQIAAMFA